MHELGTPGAQDPELDEGIAGMKARALAELELVAFGASDRVTIQLVDDLRLLAVLNTNAPVSHQRGQGGAVLDLPAPRDPVLLTPEEMLRPDPERPFYGICSVKLDPLANAIAKASLADELLANLVPLIRFQFDEFNRQVAAQVQRLAADQQAEHLLLSGDDLGGLQLWPMLGLDSAELIVVARSPRIEWLSRLSWGFRSLRGQHVHHSLDGLAGDDELLVALPGLPLDRVDNLPLVADTTTTIGVPRQLLANPPPDIRDRIACQQGALSFRFSALPDGAAVTDEMIERLARELDDGREGGSRLVRRASTFGTHDQVVYFGEGWVDTETGVTTRGPLFRPITWFHVLRSLGLTPRGDRSVTDALRWETAIDCEAFAPASTRPDGGAPRPADGSAFPSLQVWFDKELYAARQAWLGKSRYQRLKKSGVDAHAPYPTTHAVLSMTLSLVTLAASRREMDNYMDLIEPLDTFIRYWIDSAAGEPAPIDRAALQRNFDGLDRVAHARSHRDSPSRPPGVSRAFEARAGYVLARDAFRAYLDEGMRQRVPSATPLLVDGVEASLGVMFARRTAIFTVSAMRLHQPPLWGAMIHEVEHARLMLEDADDNWRQEATELVHRMQGRAVAIRPGKRGEHSGHSILKAVTSLVRSRTGTVQQQKLLATVLGRGEHLALPATDRTTHERSSPLEEIACDLAIFDSGVLECRAESLSHDERVRRFLFTFIPNLAMDQRSLWNTRLPAEQIGSWALHLGARVAADLALAPLDRDADAVAIQERLRATMDDPTWRDATAYLLHESWGRRHGDSDQHEGLPAGIRLDDARAATTRARDTLATLLDQGMYPDGPSWWAALLRLVNGLRKPAGPRPAVDPFHEVAAHLREVMAEHHAQGRTEPYPQLFSRGGLDRHGAAAIASNERLVELYTSLRGAIRSSRLRAIRRFLAHED